MNIVLFYSSTHWFTAYLFFRFALFLNSSNLHCSTWNELDLCTTLCFLTSVLNHGSNSIFLRKLDIYTIRTSVLFVTYTFYQASKDRTDPYHDHYRTMLVLFLCFASFYILSRSIVTYYFKFAIYLHCICHSSIIYIMLFLYLQKCTCEEKGTNIFFGNFY